MKITTATRLKAIAGYLAKPYLTRAEKLALIHAASAET